MVLVIPKSGLSPHMTIGQSALDSVTPDKFLEIPSYMPSFSEKDESKQRSDALSDVPSPPRLQNRLHFWSETLPFSY